MRLVGGLRPRRRSSSRQDGLPWQRETLAQGAVFAIPCRIMLAVHSSSGRGDQGAASAPVAGSTTFSWFSACRSPLITWWCSAVERCLLAVSSGWRSSIVSSLTLVLVEMSTAAGAAALSSVFDLAGALDARRAEALDRRRWRRVSRCCRCRRSSQPAADAHGSRSGMLAGVALFYWPVRWPRGAGAPVGSAGDRRHRRRWRHRAPLLTAAVFTCRCRRSARRSCSPRCRRASSVSCSRLPAGFATAPAPWSSLGDRVHAVDDGGGRHRPVARPALPARTAGPPPLAGGRRPSWWRWPRPR